MATKLTPLQSSDSTFIWSLPFGKPDTKIPLKNYEHDDRPRVPQPSLKGPTCTHYVLHLLRPRIGPNPPEALQKAREVEKLFSAFRKELTQLNYSSILNQLKSILPGMKIGSKLSDIKAMQYKKIAEMILADSSQGKLHRSITSFVTFLDAFCNQSEIDDVYVYIEKKLKPNHEAVHFEFMQKVKFDPKTHFDQYMRKKVCALNAIKLNLIPGPMREEYITQRLSKQKTWGEVSHQEAFYQQYAFLAAKSVLGFLDASWTPGRSLKDLRDCIKTQGPIIIGGSFGSAFYEKPAYEVQKVAGRAMLGWKGTDVKLTASSMHAIVLVGAAEGGSKGGFVYYVDPNDLTEQNVYVMSLENLTNNISDFIGIKYTHYEEKNYPSPYGYALYHPEYIKRNT